MQPGEGATAAEEGGRRAPDHPPLQNEHVPLWLSLLSLPTSQPFVLCPDQTAQLFILTKNWGFPKQIVNKQARLLLCGKGSLALPLNSFASFKWKCCAVLYPPVYTPLTRHTIGLKMFHTLSFSQGFHFFWSEQKITSHLQHSDVLYRHFSFLHHLFTLRHSDVGRRFDSRARCGLAVCRLHVLPVSAQVSYWCFDFPNHKIPIGASTPLKKRF